MLLNCHTYYSFKYGTYSVNELMDEVKKHGYSAFALTDINNTSAVIDAVRIAQENGLKVIPGIDFRNGVRQCYVGIAMNNDGFKELNDHLSLHLHKEIPFDERAPEFTNAYVIYPLSSYKGWPLRDYEYVGMSPEDIPRLISHKQLPPETKMVALTTVSFANKRAFNAHRLLRAIDANTLLSKLPATEQGNIAHRIYPIDEMRMLFQEFPMLMRNTEQLLNKCFFYFEFGKFANKNRHCFTGSKADDMALIRQLTNENLLYRYPNPTPEILARLDKEINVIEQLNFASYFLINWDIVRYARSKNYYYVGRGSGANSMVAYLLRITDVDPIELDLYFERFINLYRSNPPDFDIDFSWTDRDDITDYIFRTYGIEHTALLGAYNTFKRDSVFRELGKVFGLPPHEIDRLQENPDDKSADEIGKLVIKYSEYISDFPSHLSIHSSGIIISQEPITSYTATSLPPKGYPTTQFSMIEAEDIGLYKFDILSQRGLGKIKDSLEIIKKNRNVDIDIHDVKTFMVDEEVKKILRVGNTIGCFYVESPAMRMLLAKLQADDYLRLVAASSIIRPGVAKSGMMREYILRYRHHELRDQAKKEIPELYELLEETYGVMVYQEDVIKIAHYFAGLSLAEADYLRRGMSWKFKQRSEFHKVENKFLTNCRQKGYKEKTIRDIWIQIQSFANFAFSKGHSASYAVESYQALYLKAYFPLEYMVATMNNGGGFYPFELYVHEARMHGADVKPPCVNNSDELTVIKEKTIYLGLGIIAEVEKNMLTQLLAERNRNGVFKNLQDFTRRVAVSNEQIRLLIRVGAFDFTGKQRKEMQWEVHTLINPGKKNKITKELFEVENKKYGLPELYEHPLDNAFDELELLGFSLCSPFDLIEADHKPATRMEDLKNQIGETIEIMGYLITVKRTLTSRGDTMCFGTFIDLDGYWIDTVHFPPSLKQFPFSGKGCYLLKGKVTEEFDFITLEVGEMRRLNAVNRHELNKELA